MSKKLINLLRHGSLPRDNDGAIEFWRLKDDLRFKFENSQHWSDEMRKSKVAGGGSHKKIVQYCTDPPGEILYLRALQGHSGRNLIDPTSQDNVLIPTVSSSTFIAIHHQFRIDTGRSTFEQTTDSILSACGSHG